MGQADTEVLFLALGFAWRTIRRPLSPRPCSWRQPGASAVSSTRSQGTIATTTWPLGVPLLDPGTSRSLFFSRDTARSGSCIPSGRSCPSWPTDARIVVSEPIGDLPGAWIEMPEASSDQLLPFTVQPPPKALWTRAPKATVR